MPSTQHVLTLFSPQNSVKKTHRVIIVEECMRSGGIGASVSSWISENLLEELDHEVIRLSSQDVPTAYAKLLEDGPHTHGLAPAARRFLACARSNAVCFTPSHHCASQGRDDRDQEDLRLICACMCLITPEPCAVQASDFVHKHPLNVCVRVGPHDLPEPRRPCTVAVSGYEKHALRPRQ